MKLSGLIIETSPVHSTKSARPLSIVKFEFQGDNGVYKGQGFFYTSSVPNFSSILDKNCPIIVP